MMKSLSLRLMALMTLMLFLSSLVACPGSRGGGDDDDAADDDDAVSDDDDDDDDDATDDDDAAGGPETLSLCGDVGAGSIPVAGTVVVPDPDLGLLFDMYTIDALAGDCIWVRGDNGSEGADLLAFVADSAQNYYGIAQDFSQLDDDWDCTTPNADGYGCPDASVTVIADGPVMIGISMFNNKAENMTAADYTLNVAVNGTDVDPGAPVQDDQPLP
jgi:hypothetical protein